MKFKCVQRQAYDLGIQELTKPQTQWVQPQSLNIPDAKEYQKALYHAMQSVISGEGLNIEALEALKSPLKYQKMEEEYMKVVSMLMLDMWKSIK